MSERIPRSFPQRFPIVQFPNRSAMLAITAGAVGRSTSGRLARDAAIISSLASIVWAYGEITHGANWVRRGFGLVGATYAVAGLRRAADDLLGPQSGD